MITLKKVSKYFGSFQVIKNVSLEITKGEIVGFLGQNGAGKTTLMRILTTFLPATEGEVLIHGKNVNKASLEIRRKIGYLPETPPLYPSMTVKEYLKFAAELKDVSSKKLNIQMDKVLRECDLFGVKDKTIGILSKGFKQRVGIAQAIINDPQILILDEPTSGLDPVQIIQVRSLLKNLEHQRTVILSTHILSEIEQMAKRVLIIKNGEIKLDNSVEDILKQYQSLEKAFLNVVGKEAA